ncbi:hypothetical protein [Rhodococcus sp. SORGH_AS_0301]|uniref:hypothetical protein n=1 Tax=Rhodococcus sp. SORGH_AS_0301 TaxID=3041780 RepID=UPI0027812BD5|nr:hypothetical protein [Rhodococcus sp. SORGH_AS_0301]MDQ1178673.1 hypothetical protein [Rhodococcus sp. SORGH_AS_0301]
MQPGDHVKLHTNGVTTFDIVELDDTHATITPSATHADAPGAYLFRILRAGLAPANPEGH